MGLLSPSLGKSCSSAMATCPIICTWQRDFRKAYPSPFNFRGNNFKPTSVVVKSLFFDPNQVPILKQAAKEPIAFMGGMFAGILRLDLNEEPLKEWVSRTVEASAISVDEISENEFKEEEEEEDSPQQIEIE